MNDIDEYFDSDHKHTNTLEHPGDKPKDPSTILNLLFFVGFLAILIASFTIKTMTIVAIVMLAVGFGCIMLTPFITNKHNNDVQKWLNNRKRYSQHLQNGGKPIPPPTRTITHGTVNKGVLTIILLTTVAMCILTGGVIYADVQKNSTAKAILHNKILVEKFQEHEIHKHNYK